MSSARRAEAMALLDAAMAQVARMQFGADAEPVAVDVHVVFLAAIDGPIAARAQASGGGRSVCFCDGEASDAQGRIVARAMGTFRR